MKRLLFFCLLLLTACGKKEWPQPIVTEELLGFNHIEARLDQGCLLINAKVGGQLFNLEYFLVEVEEDGCPTCPFQPTFVRKYYPYSKNVYRRENSFIFTVCQKFSTQNLRVRLTADNTYRIIEPVSSEIITVTPAQ